VRRPSASLITAGHVTAAAIIAVTTSKIRARPFRAAARPRGAPRAAVDRHPYRFRQRLSFAGGRHALADECDRALEQRAHQVESDHPLAKRLESALREERLLGVDAVEDHWPSSVHDRQLDSGEKRKGHATARSSGRRADATAIGPEDC
jgi:hypothetical protein